MFTHKPHLCCGVCTSGGDDGGDGERGGSAWVDGDHGDEIQRYAQSSSHLLDEERLERREKVGVVELRETQPVKRGDPSRLRQLGAFTEPERLQGLKGPAEEGRYGGREERKVALRLASPEGVESLHRRSASSPFSQTHNFTPGYSLKFRGFSLPSLEIKRKCNVFFSLVCDEI